MKRYRLVLLFQNGSIGDFLMSIFLAEQIYRAGISQKVTIIVPRGKEFLQTFSREYPYISVVEIKRSQPWSALHLVSYIGPSILAVLPPTPGRLPLQVKFAGYLITRLPGSRLIGFLDKDPLAEKLYSTALHYDTTLPFVTTLHKLISAIGIMDVPAAPSLHIRACVDIHTRLKIEGKKYVFIHPRGSSEKRSFTLEAIGEVINTIHQHSDLHVVLSCSPSEQQWAEEVAKSLVYKDRYSIAGGLNAPELSALILGASYCIGVDTGIMHLACFLNAPILVVAHKGTSNWLPFYYPGARVLYKLEEDSEAHEGFEYLGARLGGRLKPFGRVPNDIVLEIVRTWR